MVAICTVSTQSSTSQTGQEDCVGQLCAWSRACGHTSKTASKTSRNEWIVGRGAAHTHARCREMKITNDYERTNEPASQRADGRSRHQLPISATTTMYDRSQFGPKRTGDDNVSRGPHLSDRPAGQSGILSRAEQGRAGLGRAGPVGRGCVARAMAIAGESSQLAVRLSVCRQHARRLTAPRVTIHRQHQLETHAVISTCILYPRQPAGRQYTLNNAVTF